MIISASLSSKCLEEILRKLTLERHFPGFNIARYVLSEYCHISPRFPDRLKAVKESLKMGAVEEAETDSASLQSKGNELKESNDALEETAFAEKLSTTKAGNGQK
jgi:hypothetical protein